MVEPAKITVPSLLIVPLHDTIVPPESARPLAAQLPDAKMIELDAGQAEDRVDAVGDQGPDDGLAAADGVG